MHFLRCLRLCHGGSTSSVDDCVDTIEIHTNVRTQWSRPMKGLCGGLGRFEWFLLDHSFGCCIKIQGREQPSVRAGPEIAAVHTRHKNTCENGDERKVRMISMESEIVSRTLYRGLKRRANVKIMHDVWDNADWPIPITGPIGLSLAVISSALAGKTTGQKKTRARKVKRTRDKEEATSRVCLLVGRRRRIRRDSAFRFLACAEYVIMTLLDVVGHIWAGGESVLYRPSYHADVFEHRYTCLLSSRTRGNTAYWTL
jgi:hypothetical protein